MEQICLSNVPEVVGGIATGRVTVMSVAANLVSANTRIGKIVHALALNITVKK